jgi:hypothetical protein
MAKSHGQPNNTDYWSCALTPLEGKGALSPDLSNQTAMEALNLRASRKDAYLNWRLDDGTEMAILGPSVVVSL